jgi:N-acetylglutamate synthase-like GNAT family acetyltransferase
MEIRKLTIDNYEEMTKLWSKARLPFRPSGRDSREAVAAEMKAIPDFFLGAFEDDQLVGLVVVSCDLRKGWLNRLAVDPGYRHRGVAKNLIVEAEKTLRKHGIKIFCALIEEYNDTSKEFFERCGYVEHRDIIYFSKRESDEV